MNNKTLLIVFAALLGAYLIVQMTSKKSERSFDPTFLSMDTAKVTKILVTPKSETEAVFFLERSDDGWKASKEGLSVPAQQSSITALLTQLAGLESKRIAAKKPERWMEYEVEPDKATHLQIYSGGKMVEDFYVGRFAFNQQARTATTFMRHADQDDVYAIDGFVSMTFGQGFNSYRDNSVLNFSASDVTSVNVTWTDQSRMQLTNLDGHWSFADGSTADSIKVANYLNGIQTLTSTDFNDELKLAQLNGYAQDVVRLDGNFSGSLEVRIYNSGSGEKPFILQSSQNSDAIFASDSTGIYQKLIKPLKYFTVPDAE